MAKLIYATPTSLGGYIADERRNGLFLVGAVLVLLGGVLLDLGRLRRERLPRRGRLGRQLVTMLDEGDDLPDLLVRHDAVPRRHAGHANAVFRDPEQPVVGIVRDAVNQLRRRRAELILHRADLCLCAAVAERAML